MSLSGRLSFEKMWLAAWIVCKSLKWFGEKTCTTNRNRNYHRKKLDLSHVLWIIISLKRESSRSRPLRKIAYPLLSAEGFATCIESIKMHLRGLSDSTSWNQNWPIRAKFENTRNHWELNLCVNNCKRGKNWEPTWVLHLIGWEDSLVS